MTTRVRLVGVVMAVTVWGAAAVPADPPKPITEVDLLKLIELKIPDEVIAKRIETGVEFPADEAIFNRLKKAGASDPVLAAVKKVAKAAPPSVVALWVKRNYGWDNGLHSELSINGKSLGKFTSDTDRAIGEHLKVGWNTFELKTTPVPGATEKNHLIFRIGPVHKKKDGQRVMDVLWEFENGADWKLKDGKYTHQTSPDAKDITLKYKVYYAGPETESRQIAAGDYVLTGKQEYGWSCPVTATVFVNGHAVSTFLGKERQIVITPYLRKGANTIKIVSAQVPNVVIGNDVKVWVGGPAEYNVTKGRYELTPVIQGEAMYGWKRDPKKGHLVNQVKPDADTTEKELPFTLDHEPGKK